MSDPAQPAPLPVLLLTLAQHNVGVVDLSSRCDDDGCELFLDQRGGSFHRSYRIDQRDEGAMALVRALREGELG